MPAGGKGTILSGKFDHNFQLAERQQQLTARYNFTNDWRDIPVTGGAIFSVLHSRVRTQNLSTFLNSELTGVNSAKAIFNQLRASYGRTRLNFDERRDTDFLLPSAVSRGSLSFPHSPPLRPSDQRFVLNAPLLENATLPDGSTCPIGPSCVTYLNIYDINGGLFDVYDDLGPVGQINIAGFSPVGVDVFNFPQRRVNNTYQLADTLTVRVGSHNFAMGTDVRRTELNSDLPTNARPLLAFNGTPRLLITRNAQNLPVSLNYNGFIQPLDLVAGGVATTASQTIATTDSNINLRYYQYNFFGQDEWRVRPNLSFSYGLRYEYNSPPREVRQRIESTFSSPLLALIPELRNFIGNRTKIFDPDRNNFAPRLGLAYSPNLFGINRATVLRAGFGVYYDQILGAVVSQSRNVFPNFLTVNLGGIGQRLLTTANPHAFAEETTINRINPTIGAQSLFRIINDVFRTNLGGRVPSPFAVTLPARKLDAPEAYHYSIAFEQQLNQNLAVSAAYVGTQGRKLLRATTPNLGPNVSVVVTDIIDTNSLGITRKAFFIPGASTIGFIGLGLQPNEQLVVGNEPFLLFDDPFTGLRGSGGRPYQGIGAVYIYEASANSHYDALQLQVRGRYRGLQYQGNYTLSSAVDDVSDVFDLAGASALPQNSLTRAGGRGPANFDVRHRFSSTSYMIFLPADEVVSSITFS